MVVVIVVVFAVVAVVVAAVGGKEVVWIGVDRGLDVTVMGCRLVIGVAVLDVDSVDDGCVDTPAFI